MSKFTQAELKYVQEQTRGRLATISPRGEPQVKAVGYRYNAELDTIDIAGFQMEKSQKFRNVMQNPRASFLIDDILPDGAPGFIEIRGQAKALNSGGHEIDPNLSESIIRIFPERIVAWDRSNRFPPSTRDV
ncbi:PPOX class F420-dependent oxidoreductase [Ktedonosporobacter rubrisoli]|uniref:PPOX class F420-dependent oxidoreductase n=1 Tax=Ktedonosporobacter rubrisoli TaxID=2509675 RepID=A0A4P6JJJ3_KTERU|nr:PPOX class F420-dependent oxidoreductase [Ktedonosporobacter rubrisoli]QBD75278.1 PPOX class F420-dependent oxidoreductase [Ktedonosporobacter rubrisoli]